MLLKLKRKFILVTMGIVLGMLGIIFSMLYTFTEADLKKESLDALEIVSQAARQPMGLSSANREVKQPYFAIYVDRWGNCSAAGYSYWDLTNEAFLQSLVSQVNSRGRVRGTLEKMQLMYCVTDARNAQAYVFLDISGYYASLTSLVESCIVIGVVSMAAFFVLIFFLSRWMMRPVEKSWQQQKQFISDASHELKTPLAVIMSNAELLQNPDIDNSQKEKFSESIFSTSKQMRSLVEGLLELTRADNGQVKKAFEKLNLSTCVENAVLPFEAVFFEKGLRLETSVTPNIVVTGSVTHLKQVVDILLDNAQKYASSGVVNLSLERQGKRCLLAVSNPGTPIPTEELENIFERFYRMDKARSADGSFGLGLSIAKTIIQEHRGKIWAVSNQTGNCFFVELPCE